MLHVFRNHDFTEHPTDHEQSESPPGDGRSQPMTELPISMSVRETLRSESHILESVGNGNSRDSAHADVSSGTQSPPVVL